MRASLLSVALLCVSACAQGPVKRYETAQPDRWFLNALDPHRSFVDLSGLTERPAGKRGFVRAKGDALVFGDGTPARFWGANVQAYSLFARDRRAIEAHARRIAQLGFNLVRLHHHDSATWVDPSLIADGPTSQGINEAALDTYFYWIAKLKEQGVYVFIDLHNGRPFREGDDIPGVEDLRKNAGEKGFEARGLTQVNPRLTELVHQFSLELVTRKNPYTGLALKDEPALAGILLVNENDVTHHFGNALLGDKGVPYHNAIFNRLTEEFAQKHGLDVEQVRRTWEAGPSKLFLNDLEARFNQAWIAKLRQVGVRVPIATCQMWGGEPLFSMPALTVGDILDAHTYEQGEWIDRDPRVKPHFLHWLGFAQLEGKPFVVTEWNTEDSAKAQDPFTTPMAVGAMGAFQGWDAPMIYGYSQDGLGGGARDLWSSYTHPGVTGLMPAAALMYRRDVAKAKETVVVAPSADRLFGSSVSPDSSPAIRTMLEQHRLAIRMPKAASLPWLVPTQGPGRAVDPSDDGLANNATSVRSDTGEIVRDFVRGIQTIDTARSQAAQGWIGGQKIATRAATFEIETAKAAVALSSLDGKPLADSARVLLSAVARVVPSPEGYRSEPVAGRVTVRTTAKSLILVPLAGDGSEGRSMPVPVRQGSATVDLPTNLGTHWFVLKPA